MEVAVTGMVACFLTVFYGLNLFNSFESPVMHAMAVARFAGAGVVVALLVALGDAFPRWLAFLGAAAEISAFVYYAGFTVNHEQVVFRLQEFPLIALYLSWLFSGAVSRAAIYPALVFTITYSQLWGPAIGTEHQNGVLNILSLVFFTVVGMSVGSFVKRRFRQQTEIDELTGALNRAALSRRGDAALLQAKRQEQSVSVVLIDMDGFKQINDEHGHAAGDEVLRGLVRELQAQTRKKDLVARLGGDEFVLVLPNTALAQAQQLMERIQAGSAHRWSFGAAMAVPEDNLSMVVLRADRAMYVSKRERAGQRD